MKTVCFDSCRFHIDWDFAFDKASMVEVGDVVDGADVGLELVDDCNHRSRHEPENGHDQKLVSLLSTRAMAWVMSMADDVSPPKLTRRLDAELTDLSDDDFSLSKQRAMRPARD